MIFQCAIKRWRLSSFCRALELACHVESCYKRVVFLFAGVFHQLQTLACYSGFAALAAQPQIAVSLSSPFQLFQVWPMLCRNAFKCVPCVPWGLEKFAQSEEESADGCL